MTVQGLQRSCRWATVAGLALAGLAIAGIGACSSGTPSAGQPTHGGATSQSVGQSSSQSSVPAAPGSGTASAGQPGQSAAASQAATNRSTSSSPAVSPSTTATRATRAATSGGSGCAAITASTLKAIFTVPVSSPYDGGSGSCWFGLGPNATKTGVAAETLDDDSLFVQLWPLADGAAEYQSESTKGGAATPLPGVGDKASYRGSGDDVYVLKGNHFCHVSALLGNVSEVGLPPNDVATIPEADYPKLATKLATICDDLFAAAG